MSKNFYRLQALAFENWNNARFLKTLHEELHFRSTPFSIGLRYKIKTQLDELEKDCFRFPSTIAELGSGQIQITDWNEEGLLRASGYVTGRKGLDKSERLRILDSIYTNRIPANTSVIEIESWGLPRTSQRLKKLVHSLASFTKQEKRNPRGDYSTSISHREEDLAYLKVTFYDNSNYDWIYPKT